MGNVSELREVMVNMIFNAVDAMPQGGRLALACKSNESRVTISVTDTGIGMYPEIRARVFEPFFTTKGQMGMGLGLAVSHGIVRRHGGTIEISSYKGQGTTFEMVFPRSEKAVQSGPFEVVRKTHEGDSQLFADQTISATTSEQTDNQIVVQFPTFEPLGDPPPGVRVLVIDDEPRVLAAFSDILIDLGYAVKTAVSGDDALVIARDFCPDILLVDNNMPVMGGLQTIQELRTVTPDALSILTTGYSDIAIVTKALRQSVFDFLMKPVSIENLSYSMERAASHLETRERERRQRDFLSIVSHELRAPLQAPLRYLENILTSDNHLNEEQRNMLQRATKGIKSEIRLINNLLDVQYFESGRFKVRLQSYSLRDAIHEVIESFLIQASDKAVRICLYPTPDPFDAQFDPEQIKQAVSNILNNAIQHTPSNGKVSLRLFRFRDRMRLTIRDEGPGIAKRYHERVFEKSFQLPGDIGKKGLGIGLYIAREIVRVHNGELILRSKPGIGSIFILSL